MRVIDVIKLEEGYRGQPYLCSAGATTIGYGRNLDAKPMTEKEAEHLLINDLADVIEDLRRIFGSGFFGRDLSPHRRAALVSMRYQLGPRGFRGFGRMIAAVNERRWCDAADEALDSRWARQTPERATRCARALREDKDVWREVA